MIESIHIANIATFGTTPEIMDGLSQFNFVFGSNGTGKTTISRLIADDSIFQDCSLKWTGGTKLQPLVYNRDFVERNFNQSSDLKGVFTLGEENVETLNKIAETKRSIDELTAKIEGLRLSLNGEDDASGKKGELAELEDDLKIKCWAQKQKHDAKLQGAFAGFRNSAERFKEKILAEWKTNSANLLELTDIEKKAETVFGETPSTESVIAEINADEVLGHESDPVLKKRVIGKEDVDIAAMIKKLGNSDWVRKGRDFYDANNGVCPFCQRKTEESFSQSLEEYFDEMFETDTTAIENLISNYTTDAERLKQQVLSVIETGSKFLEIESLKAEKELLDSKISVNNQKIATKKKEPSQVVELESLANVVSKIKQLITAANKKVQDHNVMVSNLASEQAKLKANVWKYLLEVELKTDLESYKNKKAGLDKAIASITQQIVKAQEQERVKKVELRNLEKQTTSIQPTIDGINLLLASFGFQSFSIAKAENETSYKLIRADGTDARDTLSEGEKNFVTFLYFYHLLKGSNSESGITTDRVVVFDDPVSSLDSDILFIVSSLIKGVFDEIRSADGYIKQVFVFTHNVYFHKEVTYNPKRGKEAMNEESFWVARKLDNKSKIDKHRSNPVRTYYELLWAELKRSDKSNLTIQNTLRRILENYFKILGGVDSDKICEMFTGQKKLICKSLFSWVHDGSHYATDDLFVSIDGAMIETYLNVFREIFEKSKHLAHYKMMMGDDYVESSAEIEVSE